MQSSKSCYRVELLLRKKSLSRFLSFIDVVVMLMIIVFYSNKKHPYLTQWNIKNRIKFQNGDKCCGTVKLTENTSNSVSDIIHLAGKDILHLLGLESGPLFIKSIMLKVILCTNLNDVLELSDSWLNLHFKSRNLIFWIVIFDKQQAKGFRWTMIS